MADRLGATVWNAHLRVYRASFRTKMRAPRPADERRAGLYAQRVLTVAVAMWLLSTLLAVLLAARWIGVSLANAHVVGIAVGLFVPGFLGWELLQSRLFGRVPSDLAAETGAPERPSPYLVVFGTPAAVACALVAALLADPASRSLANFDDGLALREDRRQEPPEQRLARVDAAGGIDRREADTIAQTYFRVNGMEFGWTEAPLTVGHEWRIPVRGGTRGALLADPIRVDARTGAVRWTDDRRSFSSLDALKAFVLDRPNSGVQVRERVQ
jgi:hypothetical protein